MPKKITTLNRFGKVRIKALEEYQKNGDAKSIAEKLGVCSDTILKWKKWYNEQGAEALNRHMKPERDSKKEINLEELEKLILQYKSVADYDAQRETRAEILVKLAQGFKPKYIAEKFNVTVQLVYKARLQYIREGKI